MTQAKKLLDVARKSALFRQVSDRQLKQILKHFHIRHLDKGDYLFRAAERSRMMFVVAEGKLRVEKLTQENQVMRIASLTAGDIVGEVAMLTGERHSGQVRATTDAVVAGIGKKELDMLLRHYPRLLNNLTRIEALRLRHNFVRDDLHAKELGFILHLYFTTPSDFRATQPYTTSALSGQKIQGLTLLDKKFMESTKGNPDMLRQGVSRALLRNPSLYLQIAATDYDVKTISALIGMADRLVITLSENKDSVQTAREVLTQAPTPKRTGVLSPIVFTVHHASQENIIPSEIETLIRLPIRGRLRLSKDFWDTDDHHKLKMQCLMLARIILSATQGIALGGGGARALSEIGIISELERLRISFDHVAGTSMGSLIAAFYAQGLTSREMSDRFREFLPSDKGLLRYNLPFISFFRDKSVNRILRRLFGKMRIEDLPKPLTIIAADLISGQEIRIRKGLIWRAVRASMSLPVIFAPVKYHGYYLVDGGAINNVPGNVLRDQGVHRILGVNCTPLEDNTVKEYLESTNLFQLLKPGDKFWSNLRRFFRLIRIFFTRPPILQIANRAMMLEGSELIRQKSREFDLLLSPDVSRFGLFEFDRREEIIDVGRYYAREHAGDLKKNFRKS